MLKELDDYLTLISASTDGYHLPGPDRMSAQLAEFLTAYPPPSCDHFVQLRRLVIKLANENLQKQAEVCYTTYLKHYVW